MSFYLPAENLLLWVGFLSAKAKLGWDLFNVQLLHGRFLCALLWGIMVAMQRVTLDCFLFCKGDF